MEYTISQKRAIDTIDKSVVVTASAGSGKTRILVGRYQNLIRHAVMPAQILTFTFTIKAAHEIKKRLVEAGVLSLTDELAAPISTLHAFVMGLLKRYGHKIGIPSEFDILDEAESLLLRHDFIKNWLLRKLDSKDNFIERAIGEWGFSGVFKLFNETVNDANLHLYNLPTDETGLFASFNQCQQDLFNEKIRLNKLDFSDLEMAVFQLLEKHTSIVDELRKQYQHILVDEFQDINPIQGRIIEKLYAPGYNFLFIVGDPKQSIYRFRQADVSVFFKMSEKIIDNGGEEIRLSESFRMSPPIANCVNKLFSNLMKIPYDPLVPQRIDEPGFVKCIIAPTSGEKIDSIRKAQAHYIAEYMTQFKDNPQELKKTAILFRSKSFFSIYTDALSKSGIPFRVSKTASLFKEQIILDLINLLNYFSGISDLLTLTSILRSPLFDFSESFIHAFTSNKITDFNSNMGSILIESNEQDKSKWELFYFFISKWNNLKIELSPHALFTSIISDLHFFNEQDHQLPGFISSIYAQTDQKYAVEQWLYLISSPPVTTENLYTYFYQQFRNLLSLEASIDCLETSGNDSGISLMSVHASKGLEFDRVFLPDIHSQDNHRTGHFILDRHEGLFAKKEDKIQIKGLKKAFLELEPYRRIKDKEMAENLEESKRLLYVAMTRAKNELFLFVKTPRNTNKDEAKNWNSWIYAHLYEECQKGDELNRSPIRENAFSNLACKIENSLAPKNKISLDTDVNEPLLQDEPATHQKPSYTVTQLESLYRCGKLFELKYIKGLGALSQSKKKSNSSNVNMSQAQWGTLIHEIFQYINFDKRDNIDTVIDQALINQGLIDSEGELKKACLELITKTCANQTILTLLQEPEFNCEKEFILNDPKFVIRGTMDRLIQKSNSAHILDYKTDFIKNEKALQNKVELYSFQLGIYALAVSKILSVKNISTSLVFTQEAKIITREWLPEELQQLDEQVQKLHGYIQNTSSFHLATNQSLCPTCPYYEFNYCGVRTMN